MKRHIENGKNPNVVIVVVVSVAAAAAAVDGVHQHKTHHHQIVDDVSSVVRQTIQKIEH